MKRLFSGIQPSGNLHIGNYLGAVRHWVLLQDRYECIFCLVDLHALTTVREPSELTRRTREHAALLIAVGIDPDRSILFVQSHIRAHAQLAWILNCVTPYGRLGRMTQFKEKRTSEKQHITSGLFTYPVLMAADILLYQSDVVPVGEDQKQHIEFTREIARKFNLLYGPVFRLPFPLIPPIGARIMDLNNPQNKMSKSVPGSEHALFLLDTAEDIRSKIMKAKTDEKREICFDPDRPGIHNLLVIYRLFSGLGDEAVEERFHGRGYQAFKSELAEMIIEHLRPIQKRYTEIIADPAQIDRLLKSGMEKAGIAAEKTIARVQLKVGLL